MGLSSLSDECCRHSDSVVEGFPWCKKIVDNILISSLDTHRSKLFLPTLSPGQAVLLQDPKTSAWIRKGVVSAIRPDHLSYTVSVDGCSFIQPRRMLHAAPLETCTPPAQAPAQITTSLPRRSNDFNCMLPLFVITLLRFFLRSPPTSRNAQSAQDIIDEYNEEQRLAEWTRISPTTAAPPPVVFHDEADLSVTNDVSHESSNVHLDQSNHGFSYINLHRASFSTGLSSVLAVIISLAVIAECCYVRGRRQ